MTLPTTPVKVVLVDDSVVIRRVLHDLLSAEPEIEVVATAPNGKIGLDKIRATRPDIVILDIEMPVMDGLTTLKQLRHEFPRLPVLMFSTLTTRGGSATLDALALGATDYLTKPETIGGREHAIESIRAEMVPKIKVLGRVPSARPRPASPLRAVAPVPAPRAAGTGRIDVVAVAVSTGGPRALQDIVPRLPAHLPVPMVMVQHMPPVFTGLLAERLDRAAAIHVVEAEDGMHLEAGTLYIAPGGRHLVVKASPRGVVTELNDEVPENSCRPSADPLFRSVVRAYGAHTLGVVLTGMGSDGCKGAEAIVQAGGEVIAQDEASSVVWGMPGAVVHHGLASAVVPLGRVVDEIVARTARARSALSSVGARR
jgi:two-component system, chemotaxis family, protein-glutamate methylesterase/glutaminase